MPDLNPYELWALFMAAKVSLALTHENNAPDAWKANWLLAWQQLGRVNGEKLIAKLEPIASSCFSMIADDMVASAAREAAGAGETRAV